MPDNTPKELHTPVAGLIALHQKLVAGLAATGASAADLNELFARDVTGTCVKCGMQISGTELATAALAASPEVLTEPKLARLRQGYCGRNGCDSNYYTVRLAAHPKLDWERLLTGPVEAAPEPESEPKPATEEELAAASEALAARRRRWVRVAIGIGALLVLLAIRHVINGGRIPIFQPKPEYRTGAPAQVE
jgi:hypothetical protein